MMNEAQVFAAYRDYVAPSYARLPLCLVSGRGCRVTDINGREYLDFFPGWAVSGVGHCHPRVTAAVRDQAGRALHFANNFHHPLQARLAAKISAAAFPGRCFFCNSGAEANEGAVKLARLAGYRRGRHQVISFAGSFHGRSLATLTLTGQRKVQRGFTPLPPGFPKARFNDLDSVERLVGPRTAAIFLEPVLGEGGVVPADADFLRGLRRLCDREQIMLIFDEVQTGMGRTGHLFAFQRYGVIPDALTLAKSLGGGVPIGAVHARPEFADLLQPGTHGSTFGGGPLACAAALAVFEAIEAEGMLANVRALSGRLERGLAALSPRVRAVRGFGFMLGVELDGPGDDCVNRAREAGLLINCTQGNILRVMPPLNVSAADIDLALDIMAKCLN